MKFDLKKPKRTFGWDGLRGWVYSEKKDFKNASAAYIETTTPHGKTKNTKSDLVYFVVGGKGEFKVGDKVLKVVSKDIVIIPKNTSYDYKSVKGIRLKLFLVHAPAFDSKYSIRLAK